MHLIDIIAHGSHRVATAQRTGNLLALCLDTKITAGQYRVSGKDLVVWKVRQSVRIRKTKNAKV